MSKTAVYDYSTSPASNTDIDGTDATGSTGLVKSGDNYARSMMSHLKGFALDLGAVNTVGGTADATTVTLAAAPSALVDGMRLVFNAVGANTGAMTLNVTPAGGSAFGAKKVMKWEAGSEAELSANDVPAANALIEVIYDSARNSSAGAWMKVGASVAAATTSAAGIVEHQFNTFYNIGFACSVGSSALTLALKDADGNDPSSSSPVVIPFRNVTATTGTPTYLTVTAATSLVISSGSTLGAPTGSVPFKVWVVGFNDAGTFRLGAIVCSTLSSGVLTQYPLGAWGIASSTAEGGAGAADSAQTFYTGAAVTSKAYAVLAVLHFESGLATAGTWASAPTRTQIFGADVPLPGRPVNIQRNQISGLVSGSTILPVDDTIPQNTEGNQIVTQAITPSSAANLLEISFSGYGTNSTAAAENITTALFQDSTANALAASLVTTAAVNYGVVLNVNHLMVAATTSSTTFKVRVGAGGATINVNGISGGRLYGGASPSVLRIVEISA